MIQIFTPNDLVRYIYNEMPEEEAEKLEEALLFDEELAENLQQLLGSSQQIATDKICLEPSEKSINSILEYSKSFDLHTIDK